MVIVTTAISGTGEKEYLERFAKYAKTRGKKIKIFNVGEMILALAKLSRSKVNPNNILNMRSDTMWALRKGVFESILRETPNLTKDGYSIVVNIHGIFYWKYRYKKSIDYSDISQLNPDIYVNFLNNSDIVAQNMRCQPKWNFLFRNRPSDYTLERIMEWQTAEIEIVDTVATFSGKQLFIVPAGGSESILFRFMFDQSWRKVF